MNKESICYIENRISQEKVFLDGQIIISFGEKEKIIIDGYVAIQIIKEYLSQFPIAAVVPQR